MQWIFVYEPLAHMLVEHARAIGTDPAIVERAEHVLHQPGDSAPHDDHFHVRIYCSRDDLLEGCANWGPEWPHAELWEDAVLERIDELTRGIADPDAATGSACAERATSLAGDAYGPTLATALPHAEPETQLAIMELLAEIDEPGAAGPLVALLESSPHEDVREQSAWLLGYLADPGTARPLAELVARDGAPLRGDVSLSAAAAIALRNVWSAESVEHLVAVSGHTDPDAREAISVVLSRATGKAAPGTEETTSRDLDPVTLEQHWKAWFVAHGADGQDAWYRAAFSAAGYEVGETWADIPLSELVRALRDDADHIRFIADRTLLQRTDGWTPSEGWSVERRHRYWSRRLGLR